MEFVRRWLKKASFRGSADYWESRYQRGGDSGAGSYGDLASFKAETLNRYVAEQGVASVLEFGCGDGNQLSMARYPSYTGLDVSREAVQQCVARFRDDATKSFFLYDPTCFADSAGRFQTDMTMSLDVIFHLVEDEVFETHLRHLFGSARRHVVVYSTDSDLGRTAPHVRHRAFSPRVTELFPDWNLTAKIPYPKAPTSGPGADRMSTFFFYQK